MVVLLETPPGYNRKIKWCWWLILRYGNFL